MDTIKFLKFTEETDLHCDKMHLVYGTVSLGYDVGGNRSWLD